jgi:hypothetical protein
MKEIGYRLENGRTTLSLEFEPYDAYFIVLKGKAETSHFMSTYTSISLLEEIKGDWKVSFEDKFGQKKEAILDSLVSWSQHENKWIKYFSGTATYRKTITVPEFSGKLILDLGEVKNIAEVSVNGKKAATLWKTPFKADITEMISGKTAEIEIKVTNLWVNRLIGESGVPAHESKSYTSTRFYSSEDKLLPSGLLGQVKLWEQK